jgi:Mg-chelatase subunit ChlD
MFMFSFRPRLSVALATGAALLTGLAVSTPAAATLTPTTGTLTVPAGSSASEAKVIDVPAVAPLVDIEIAIDTTGSMSGTIAQAQSEATTLVNTIKAAAPGAQFAIVNFRDMSDTPEYSVVQPMTADATAVNNAVATLFAGGGGDTPEAYNLVFHNSATPATGGDLGWRAGSRKFVVVIGDAPPHASSAITGCADASADPNGLDPATELAAMKAAQRTLYMVDAGSMATCYASLADLAYAGGRQIALGSSLTTDLLAAITETSTVVHDLHLAVTSATPAPAAASWVTFSTPLVDVAAGAKYDATATVTVPAGTAAGTYTFVIEALADGASVGTQTLTVQVPVATVLTAKSFSISVCKNAPVAVKLSGSGSTKPLTYTIVDKPTHGTISGGTGPNRTYTPAAGWTGTDSFTYTVSDGAVTSAKATVTVTVATRTSPVHHKHHKHHAPKPHKPKGNHSHN